VDAAEQRRELPAAGARVGTAEQAQQRPGAAAGTPGSLWFTSPFILATDPTGRPLARNWPSWHGEAEAVGDGLGLRPVAHTDQVLSAPTTVAADTQAAARSSADPDGRAQRRDRQGKGRRWSGPRRRRCNGTFRARA
jgi:hypothetical protein